MTKKYEDCITKVSDIIFKTILEKEENLSAQFFLLDETVFSILREIGLKVMSMLLSLIVTQVTLLVVIVFLINFFKRAIRRFD